MYCALLTIHVLFFRFFIARFALKSLDLFGGGEDSGVYFNENGSLKKYLSEWINYFIIGKIYFTLYLGDIALFF